MCGIVGYTGKGNAAPALIDGLYRLEYRGYDSAGIAVEGEDGIQIVKRAGRVKGLECARELEGHAGIGHTRWATHGAPTERNAHPHAYSGIVLVHNGIIENAYTLREGCLARGETFVSDTDSEVIAHLIAAEYRGNLLEAVRAGCEKLKGSYALAVMCEKERGKIVCTRKRSPLIVARSGGNLLVASDLPALAGEAEAYALGEGEFALLDGDITFYDASLSPIQKVRTEFDASVELADRGGYPHFMRKEMAEIPAAMRRTREEAEKTLSFSPLYEVLCQTEYIQILGCGTAYHAGLCAKAFLEARCRLPSEACIASEYRYRDPIVPSNTLAVAVSQSGETADTIAAAELAKKRGARLVAVTNSPDSSLNRMADFVLPTRAGREVAVAATKSFNAQLVALYRLSEALARAKGKPFSPLPDLSAAAEETLLRSERVENWIKSFQNARTALFIGRGADFCAALEGSLKLKEISYLPSEGYPAGELKHGTLALIEDGTPVVAVLTCARLAEKTMNAVHEAYARGAHVFLVTSFPEYAGREAVRDAVLLPSCDGLLSPVLSVIPLQMLAYFVSVARGADPDKPRNLAKSVTVE